MARGLNKITIIGNLGRDAEMKYTPNGTAVTEFSVAVSRRRRSQEGQATEETDWFRVICWEKLAEIADQYLKKGARVYIEGRLQVRKYTGNDGQERTAVEIIANDLLMLSSREDGAVVAGNAPARAVPADDLDDLPF